MSGTRTSLACQTSLGVFGKWEFLATVYLSVARRAEQGGRSRAMSYSSIRLGWWRRWQLRGSTDIEGAR